MKVNLIILASHPFIEAFIYSDFFGKLIIISLIAISIITWALLLQKYFMVRKLQTDSKIFHREFEGMQQSSASLFQFNSPQISPFAELFTSLKQNTSEILQKNSHFGRTSHHESTETKAYLSEGDIEYVEAKLYSTKMQLVQSLEKNLYILAIVVGLAPFLGLLGTVWGILTTFSEMQAGGAAGSNQAVLGGLSMALATTVLGLLDAIPALVGYGWFKNAVKEHDCDLERFSHSLLSQVELQYRHVVIHP